MLKFPKPGKKKKKTRQTDKAHLAFVAALPCLCCKLISPTVVPHHLMRDVNRGIGMKADDKHTIPLCHRCHTELHMNGDEKKYLASKGIKNPVLMAESLYKLSKANDIETAAHLVCYMFSL